jgi:hypothetical protein
MVKVLTEAQRRLEVAGSTWFSYSTYSGFCAHDITADPEGKIAAFAKELEAKYEIAGMKDQKDKLDKRIDEACERIQAGLTAHNERLERERKGELKGVKLAIRDIWATDTIEEAKAIVAPFVK